jgi:hypothetical protein
VMGSFEISLQILVTPLQLFVASSSWCALLLFAQGDIDNPTLGRSAARASERASGSSTSPLLRRVPEDAGRRLLPPPAPPRAGGEALQSLPQLKW